MNSDDVQMMINIVEDFLKIEDVICYGGTAINNILPEADKFYNTDIEIPDYDFFSFKAIETAKKLAMLYHAKGFTEVEAKSGQHHGTYKVYVNFIPVADITQLPIEIFRALKKDSIRVGGIMYASPNFLRMSMYLELSRPDGDISRWEKVLKRLSLLNKNHPLMATNCDKVEVQRSMKDKSHEGVIFDSVRDTLINQGVVFFGGFAISLYSEYMPKSLQRRLKKIADFDVIAHDPDTTAQIVKERLKDVNISNCTVVKHEKAGEIVPEHCEIKVGVDTIAFIYKPIACHSYNMIEIGNKKVKIATIDTMLSFYLAFLYVERPYYQEFSERILCMSKFLFEVQQKNRLEQKGVLKRFSTICYGHQESIEEMRAEKAAKYKELKTTKNAKEKETWFMKFVPSNQPTRKIQRPNRSRRRRRGYFIRW